MGILSRLFGTAAPRSQRNANLTIIRGPGTFSVDVVGESRYQDALEDICGGRSGRSADHPCIATLVPEDGNPYDRHAVRVDIEGRTVGYLSYETAWEYRQRQRDAGIAGRRAACHAKIVGGWDRGGNDWGYFGVKLDLPKAG